MSDTEKKSLSTVEMTQTEKERWLQELPEDELRKVLLKLFEKTFPDASVIHTHGTTEYGSDITVIDGKAIGVVSWGFVVKAGRITGKTVGEVDDIISQVKQALEIPRPVPGHSEEIRLDKVMVVLPGHISENALKRLREQVIIPNTPKVDTIMRADLVRLLNDSLPSAFGASKQSLLVETLVAHRRRLLLRNKSSKLLGQYELTDVFIEPVVSRISLPVEVTEKTMVTFVDEAKHQPFSFLHTLTRGRGKRLLLVGQRGCGKSGALLMMANQAIEKAIRETKKGESTSVPLLIRADDLRTIEDVESLKKFCLPEELQTVAAGVLLVDALDEIRESDRPSTMKKALDFSRHLDTNVVVTCRKSDAVNLVPQGLEKYELLPFEVGQVARFVEKLKGKLSTRALDSLSDAIDKVGEPLICTPLSLSLLVRLASEEKEIPASMTELYERYVNLVLGEWDQSKGIDILFEYKTKKKFLAELAYVGMLRRGRFGIPVEEYEQFCVDYAERYGDLLFASNQDASLGKLKWELSSSNLLAEESFEGETYIVFTHRSFLDFFAALYVVQTEASEVPHLTEFQDKEDFVKETFFDDGLWGDLPFFYVGLKTSLSPSLLDGILTHQRQDLQGLLSRIGIGLLLQAGWHSPLELKTKGVASVVALVPTIREKLIEVFEKLPTNPEMINADRFIFWAIECCFSSAKYLSVPNKAVFDALVAAGKRESLYAALALLRPLAKCESQEFIKEAAESLLGRLKDHSGDKQFYGIALLGLEPILDPTTEFGKQVQKDIRKHLSSYPKLFSKYLPKPKAGYTPRDKQATRLKKRRKGQAKKKRKKGNPKSDKPKQ